MGCKFWTVVTLQNGWCTKEKKDVQQLVQQDTRAITHSLQHIHIWHWNTTGTSKTDDLRRRHRHNINAQRHKHSKSKHPIIPTWNTYMDSDKQPHPQPDKTTCTLFTQDPAEYSTQLELQIDNITLPMNINPKILGLTLDPKLTYNKSIQDNTDTQNTHINNMGKTKENYHRNIQSHNMTHIRVRFHHMVTTSIRHKRQQTIDNTKHRIHNSNWVHNRHKHKTSTRRNAPSTHEGTPTTTRITDNTKITTPDTPTTLHHNPTNNTPT